MKKRVQFVVVTLILLVGGVLTGMAQDEIIYRSQTCSPGQTFHVSFWGIYNGNQNVVLRFYRFMFDPFYEEIPLGEVSAYTKCCISSEDEGYYLFGTYINNFFVVRLQVTLIVSNFPMAFITREIDLLKKNKRSNPFGQLICTRTKSLIWRSKMCVLA